MVGDTIRYKNSKNAGCQKIMSVLSGDLQNRTKNTDVIIKYN